MSKSSQTGDEDRRTGPKRSEASRIAVQQAAIVELNVATVKLDAAIVELNVAILKLDAAIVELNMPERARVENKNYLG